MDINNLANEARTSISKFCIEECKAFCCRKGILPMNKKEADLITNSQTAKLIKSQKVFVNDKNSFVLDLSSTCPSLKNNMCTIHNNPDRPSVCKQFPIFVEKESIRLAKNCPAVKNNLFYPYERQFVKLGYEIIISHEHYHS